MQTCPDCFSSIDLQAKSSCGHCGWESICNNGIYDMLSSSDRGDSLFRQYINLYEDIAKSEIEAPINSDVYVRSMALRTASLLGDLQGKDVCDIGSGKGFLLAELARRQPRSLTAIDIARSYLEKIDTPNVKKMVANAENLPFEAEFDVVVSTDVMEHVLNVGSLMYGVNRMLKVGGIFTVRVPYMENLLQYGRHAGSPYPFTHLRTYDLKLLKHQVKQAGFQPVKIQFDGFQPGYPRSLFSGRIGAKIFKALVIDRYADYWDVTKISSFWGWMLMKPIEVNLVCKKVHATLVTQSL